MNTQEYYRRSAYVNQQLTARGSRTFGSLERREERLSRFLDIELEHYTRRQVATILLSFRNAPTTHCYNLRSRNEYSYTN